MPKANQDKHTKFIHSKISFWKWVVFEKSRDITEEEEEEEEEEEDGENWGSGEF